MTHKCGPAIVWRKSFEVPVSCRCAGLAELVRPAQLIITTLHAMMAELADALALGASVRKDVQVQVLLMAPMIIVQAGTPALEAGIRKEWRFKPSPRHQKLPP